MSYGEVAVWGFGFLRVPSLGPVIPRPATSHSQCICFCHVLDIRMNGYREAAQRSFHWSWAVQCPRDASTSKTERRDPIVDLLVSDRVFLVCQRRRQNWVPRSYAMSGFNWCWTVQCPRDAWAARTEEEPSPTGTVDSGAPLGVPKGAPLPAAPLVPLVLALALAVAWVPRSYAMRAASTGARRSSALGTSTPTPTNLTTTKHHPHCPDVCPPGCLA